MKPCVLCDIEGTISNNAHRLQFIPEDGLPEAVASKAWDDYFAMLLLDPPYSKLIYLLSEANKTGKNPLILTTAIPRKFVMLVKTWLKTNQVDYHKLMLRDNGDFRTNAEVKSDMLKKLREAKYQPKMAIDDMPDTLDMFRANGINNCMLAKDGVLSSYKPSVDQPADIQG